MMDKQLALRWLNQFADEVIRCKELLSMLDTAIGDGDHGVNMARGANMLKESFKTNEPESLQDVFKIAGMTLLSKVGGASGPLYGSAFISMAKSIDSNELTHEQLTNVLEAGLNGIKQRGKAVVGEKTMIDVWQPAVEAMASHQLSFDTIDASVEGTKEIRATKGRAAFLGERSIGHIDPGAYSSSLLFKSLLEAGGVDD